MNERPFCISDPLHSHHRQAAGMAMNHEERLEMPMHFAGVSYGKDSLASVILALRYNEPLDEAVYCEVMFDDGISGEVPEHRVFIYNVAMPPLQA